MRSNLLMYKLNRTVSVNNYRVYSDYKVHRKQRTYVSSRDILDGGEKDSFIFVLHKHTQRDHNDLKSLTDCKNTAD